MKSSLFRITIHFVICSSKLSHHKKRYFLISTRYIVHNNGTLLLRRYGTPTTVRYSYDGTVLLRRYGTPTTDSVYLKTRLLLMPSPWSVSSPSGLSPPPPELRSAALAALAPENTYFLYRSLNKNL